MNREILFRGKVIDNSVCEIIAVGEFIYGDLIHYANGETFIRQQETGMELPVNPNTVGQYIGGKGFVDEANCHFTKGKSKEVKLFDGDIVEAWSEGRKGLFIIKFRCFTFILCPAWHSRQMWNIHFSDIGREKGDYFDNLRVIGNIYDMKILNC